jgi:hypothetical protein
VQARRDHRVDGRRHVHEQPPQKRSCADNSAMPTRGRRRPSRIQV